MWYQISFISEAVAPDTYKHAITTRITTLIMNTEVFNNYNLEMKDDNNNNNNVCELGLDHNKICFMQIHKSTPTYSSPIA